jgi:hypothetical protein
VKEEKKCGAWLRMAHDGEHAPFERGVYRIERCLTCCWNCVEHLECLTDICGRLERR